MEQNTVSFKHKISQIGGTVGTTIPKELIEFLDVKEGTDIRLGGFSGKYGRYIAIWAEEYESKSQEEINEIVENEAK